MDIGRSGILVIDRQMRVISVNSQMRRLFPDIDVTGKPHCHAVCRGGGAGGPCPECPVAKTFADGEPHEARVVKDIEGRRKAFHVVSSPVRDGCGQLTAVIGLVEEVREDRTGADGVTETVSLFTTNVAHDYRNILTALKGNILLIRDQEEEDPEKADIIGEMELAIERCLRLTRQLELFSSGTAPEPSPISIRAGIVKSVESLLEGTGFSCSWDLPLELPKVAADIVQLEQVIGNLVANAMQAMPDGGEIDIRAERIIIGDDDAGRLASGEYLRITVSDHGHGIEAHDIPYVFVPYFTTRETGTGLGLTLCRMMIKNLGGDVRIESRAGEGTKACVYLPAVVEGACNRER